MCRYVLRIFAGPVTNIDKSIAYIINKSGGARWLPVQADQWHLMGTQGLIDIWQASETSLRKSRPVKFWHGVVKLAYWWSYWLAIIMFFCHCVSVYVAGFGKFSHICWKVVPFINYSWEKAVFVWIIALNDG